jgi:hypothetical protein
MKLFRIEKTFGTEGKREFLASTKTAKFTKGKRFKTWKTEKAARKVLEKMGDEMTFVMAEVKEYHKKGPKVVKETAGFAEHLQDAPKKERKARIVGKVKAKAFKAKEASLATSDDFFASACKPVGRKAKASK